MARTKSIQRLLLEMIEQDGKDGRKRMTPGKKIEVLKMLEKERARVREERIQRKKPTRRVATEPAGGDVAATWEAKKRAKVDND
jgi:hypothetical protein